MIQKISLPLLCLLVVGWIALVGIPEKVFGTKLGTVGGKSSSTTLESSISRKFNITLPFIILQLSFLFFPQTSYIDCYLGTSTIVWNTDSTSSSFYPFAQKNIWKKNLDSIQKNVFSLSVFIDLQNKLLRVEQFLL